MTDSFIEFMVDLETTGLETWRSGITSFAIIPFHLHGTILETQAIVQAVSPAPYNKNNFQTMEWREQHKITHGEDKLEKVDPRTMLNLIDNLVNTQCGKTMLPRFWSKPSNFDYPFLLRYYEYYDRQNPFHYRHITDVRSFILGTGWHPELVYDKNPNEQPHVAYYDALAQIKAVQWVAKSMINHSTETIPDNA